MTTKVLGDGRCLMPFCNGEVQFKESKKEIATYYCHGCGCQFQGRTKGLFDAKVRRCAGIDEDTKKAMIKAEEKAGVVPLELVAENEKQGGFAGWLNNDD